MLRSVMRLVDSLLCLDPFLGLGLYEFLYLVCLERVAFNWIRRHALSFCLSMSRKTGIHFFATCSSTAGDCVMLSKIFIFVGVHFAIFFLAYNVVEATH